jgi:PHD-like zinc-binding domain
MRCSCAVCSQYYSICDAVLCCLVSRCCAQWCTSLTAIDMTSNALRTALVVLPVAWHSVLHLTTATTITTTAVHCVHSPECYVHLREGQDPADSSAPVTALATAELEGAHWFNAVKAKKRGKNIKCAGCGKLGATVGCYTAACKKSYHYPCALASGWEFGDVPDSHGKVFR